MQCHGARVYFTVALESQGTVETERTVTRAAKDKRRMLSCDALVLGVLARSESKRHEARWRVSNQDAFAKFSWSFAQVKQGILVIYQKGNNLPRPPRYRVRQALSLSSLPRYLFYFTFFSFSLLSAYRRKGTRCV